MTNQLSAMNSTTAPLGEVPFIDEAKDTTLSGQQIISFVTQEAQDVESIPAPMDLSEETLSIISETRDHTIKDILCREYPILDGTIPVGGTINDILFNIAPLDALLAKSNIIKKTSQFLILRTNLKMRIEFTTPPTIGGAVMATFYPDLSDVAILNRLTSRLQRSQAPRQEILLSTVSNFYLDIPWISPFYARNLTTGTGNIGRIVLSRITASNTAVASYKVYVQCDPATLKIEYPTFNPVALPQREFEEYIEHLRAEQMRALSFINMRVEKRLQYSDLDQVQQQVLHHSLVFCEGKHLRFGRIFSNEDPRYSLVTEFQLQEMLAGRVPEILQTDWHLEKEDIERSTAHPQLQGKKEAVQQEKKGKISGMLDAGSKIATIASGIPVLGSVASVAAPILSVGSKIAGLLGFSKTIAEKPIRAVRWKPADSHLTNEGVLPSHSLALTGSTMVNTPSGMFGSEMDEMATSFIERSTAIIGDFRVSTSTPVNTIVYAVPCTIAQFETIGDDYFFTHQTWLANTMEKWLAKLIFDINFTGNSFHIAKLRLTFNPGDRGSYSVGETLPLDSLGDINSKVVAFGETIPNNSISIEPVSTTTMKLVPSSRNPSGVGSPTLYAQNRYLEECSFGMIYISVEVSFKATSDIVAQYADFYVTFSAEDLMLSHPVTHLPFAPRLQGLRTEITENSVKASRSERFELKSSQYLKSTAGGAPIGNYTLCCGDRLESIKNLLNCFYVFSPTIQIQAFQSLMIMPYAVRALQNQTQARQFRNFDQFDYFAVGYGFYKGSMNIRLSKLDSNQPMGEILLQSPHNNFINPSFSRFTSQAYGYTSASTTALARSGTRVVPIFSEECTPDITIPYYSPFHISRVSTNSNTSYETGRLDNNIVVQPFNTQSYRIYRAVGDDFHFGTLTSLPPFNMDVLNILIT